MHPQDPIRTGSVRRQDQNWAYRPSDILPSHVQSQAACAKVPLRPQGYTASVRTLAPDLSGVALGYEI